MPLQPHDKVHSLHCAISKEAANADRDIDRLQAVRPKGHIAIVKIEVSSQDEAPASDAGTTLCFADSGDGMMWLMVLS